MAFSDFDDKTWPKLLEELLNRKNFNFQRQHQNKSLAGPDWDSCQEHEFQLRKEAFRLTREEGLSIAAALWQAYRSPQHRMEHWITFLTVANAKSEKEGKSKSEDAQKEIAKLRKENAQLRSQWSRTPKNHLAQQIGTAQSSGNSGSKGQGGKGGKQSSKGRGRGKGAPQTHTAKGFRTFNSIQKANGRLHFHAKDRGQPGVCYKFQKGLCQDATSCGREHCCVGCGQPGVQYDNCGCLESVVPKH